MHALEAKREQLGLPSSDTEISTHVLRTMKKPVLWRWFIKPQRPACTSGLPGWFIPYRHFNADMLLEKTANALHRRVLTRCVTTSSYNDTLRLIAKGPEAEEGTDRFPSAG